MSAYTASSPFDQQVEKATPDSSGEANWALILEICDKAGRDSTGPKDCLRSVMKRLNHNSKNVQVHSITLLDSCVLNCGTPFHKEVATPEFVKDARVFLTKAAPDVTEKFKENLKKWAEQEFKSDSQLSVIPTFYQALRTEGAYFGMGSTSTAGTMKLSSAPAPSSNVTSGNPDSDLEKAIALSLKESKKGSGPGTSSLYPQMAGMSSSQSAPSTGSSNNFSNSSLMPSAQPAGRQVRALYDFEAAEDNELTFKGGELITVLDDSDANWWKGSTWRGEGLFPANFVSNDLTLENGDDHSKKSVQFNEEVQVEQFDPNEVTINEKVIDQALDEIQNADPTGQTEDSSEMLNLEKECQVMGPLIDQELEQIDAKHNELMNLNKKLTDSFQLYYRLMKDATMAQYGVTPQQSTYMPQQQQTQAGAYGLPPQHSQTLPTASMYSSPSQLPDPNNQQAYYNGAYGATAAQQTLPQELPPQQQPPPQQPPQYSQQADMFQQYQMGGTNVNGLQYMPNVAMNGSPAQSFNTGQPMYNPAMQPPQQLS